MSVTAAPSAATRLPQPYAGLAVAWNGLRGLKILLPCMVLVAIWWAIKASGDFPDNVLVSPLQAWHAFVHLTTHGVMAEYASTSLAIIWFGFSHTTTLVIVVYSLIVPIIFNTMIGVRAIPENYTMALRSLGAGRLRLVTDVYLPGALPSIVVGLRLGMGYGWRALIAAEMLVRKGGLGDLIFGARTFGQIDRIIIGMIMIGCLYIVVDRLIVQPIENITVARWGMLRK